ncbi:hypothetical protein [Ancylomarina sp. 16SWW S1-10-2]|uniref:hypothetical protein n=1 Tax=Ancylomarina sp. 16SWW S1-10-2 TaxID=2499681 RepID=UPI0012AD30FC|nr:hypothetical protein [Ancylomarina sp. 16SWW S1-10-2]MRT92383.1 hypothetical protein [Ancylomarina sp. 16SWW S1-10-2]
MFVIETIRKGSLYAIKYNNEYDEFENNELEDDQSSKDEFRRLFNNWADTEYLHAFFDKHNSDLKKEFYNSISIEDAIFQTIDEAEKLEQTFLEISELGKTDDTRNLQTLFKPLNKRDEKIYPIPDFQESKVYGSQHKSWLRIYAIRIEKNVFVVTGGAIKLVQKMDERDHLKKELEKLEQVKNFLIDKDIITNVELVEFCEL